jgi:Spherulation-specific family 4
VDLVTRSGAARSTRRTRGTLRPRLLLLLAAVLGPLAALAIVRASAAGDGGESCSAALIPAYVPAAQLAQLADWGAPAGAPPRLVILNPASGPGTAPRASLGAAAGKLRESGARLLGYVPTTYGARDPDEVQREVERYRRWYDVDGIFLDEASSRARDLPYYGALGRRIRATGASPLVLNPGRVPAEGYMDEADVVVTFEGPAQDYERAFERTPDWLRERPARSVAHLVFGASREQALRLLGAERHAGYVYFTDGTLPNPWGSIPPYLGEQQAALRERCAEGN